MAEIIELESRHPDLKNRKEPVCSNSKKAKVIGFPFKYRIVEDEWINKPATDKLESDLLMSVSHFH